MRILIPENMEDNFSTKGCKNKMVSRCIFSEISLLRLSGVTPYVWFPLKGQTYLSKSVQNVQTH